MIRLPFKVWRFVLGQMWLWYIKRPLVLLGITPADLLPGEDALEQARNLFDGIARLADHLLPPLKAARDYEEALQSSRAVRERLEADHAAARCEMRDAAQAVADAQRALNDARRGV